MRPCPACGGSAASTFEARELMRGSGEVFQYGRCARCGSLWLLEIPADLDRYYGDSYYSLQAAWRVKFERQPWRATLKRARDGWQLFSAPLWGSLLALKSRYPELDSLRRANPLRVERILDVGCGDGFLVYSLGLLGFQDVTGIDPQLISDLAYSEQARLLRLSLEQVQGTFDLVLMNHSLEHMPDPAVVLARAAAILQPGGRLLIRVPVADSDAFERFGPAWVQVDPPRHLCLFTRRALKHLAEAHGFEAVAAFDDSTSFQFWGSLQAQAGVPLEDPRSVSQGGDFCSAAELKSFEREARRLNASHRGDSHALLLRKL